MQSNLETEVTTGFQVNPDLVINKQKIVGAEAENLLEIPEKYRDDAYSNFQVLKKLMPPKNIFEASKMRESFYQGYAAGIAKATGETV